MTGNADARIAQMVAAHSASPLGVSAAIELAAQANETEHEALALPVLTSVAAKNSGDFRLWQWIGLLQRGLDRRDLAIPAFEAAARLAPRDALVAHSLARVMFEAGLPALDQFDRALSLAPQDSHVMLGRAAARFALGDGDGALDDLDAQLQQRPDWLEGHRDRIHLGWMLGHGDSAFDTFKRALQADTYRLAMWQTGIVALIDAGRHQQALGSIRNARKLVGETPFFDLHEAIILSELGQTEAADRKFSASGASEDPLLGVHLVRHDLRNGRLDTAATRLDGAIARHEASALWPYADIVWRLTGDDRQHWLDCDHQLIKVIDLADDLPPLDRLAGLLRGLHTARHEHLDQSVRGGTQTDGALFSRIEPDIMAVRAVIAHAVADYVRALPQPDPTHPLLSIGRKQATRFSGSWSVRLAGRGHHANHVHPAGVISSALYVSLPPADPQADGRAGWLTMGEPQAELGISLSPFRHVEPKPGQLVLFPSYLWHGTVPFDSGERLTIAFDVARPRQRLSNIG